MNDTSMHDAIEAEARQAKLDDLREKHGKLIVVEDAEYGTIAFRRPNRIEYRAFKAQREDEATKAVADERFLTLLRVYPSPSEFDAILDESPGLTDALGAAVAKAIGLRKLEAKKD